MPWSGSLLTRATCLARASRIKPPTSRLFWCPCSARSSSRIRSTWTRSVQTARDQALERRRAVHDARNVSRPEKPERVHDVRDAIDAIGVETRPGGAQKRQLREFSALAPRLLPSPSLAYMGSAIERVTIRLIRTAGSLCFFPRRSAYCPRLLVLVILRSSSRPETGLRVEVYCSCA